MTNEAQARLVATMQRSGARLLRLVDDILDFSRVEAGQTTLRDDLFDLYGLLDELAANTRITAEAKGVELTCTIDPAVPHQAARRRRPGQPDRRQPARQRREVHRPGLRAHRRLASTAAVGEHGTVVIRVEDSGIGMSPDQCDRIFESFRQADPSITRSYGGTGLGLAICRRLVELMGGTIAVESTFAEGTVFTVRVPLGLVVSSDQPDLVGQLVGE